MKFGDIYFWPNDCVLNIIIIIITTIILLADILKALDGGDLVMLTLLDLSAAFDTVDHGILLRRLETSYGLQSCVLKWFSSYVDRRTHFVRCGAFKSVPTLVLSGVPQGSVLGPILFLLYTAYLVLLIQRHDPCPQLYADDTQIYGRSLHVIRRQRLL